MKKVILLFLAIAMSAVVTIAQDEARLGVKVAWDLNSPSTSYNEDVKYSNGSGFSVGAIYNIPFYKGMYAEPGLSFYYNTMGRVGFNEEFEGVMNDLTGSLRNAGFRVPIVIGYRFEIVDGIALSVFTGPQINYGLIFKEHLSSKALSDSDSMNLYEDDYRRLDAQWLVGLRFHYQNNWFAEISGGVGMTNMLKGSKNRGEHFRRNTFSVGVGYMF